MTDTEKTGTGAHSLATRIERSFQRFARGISILTGKPAAFIIALIVLIVWALTGLLFHFSDTWQLVINTGTSLVTFLMVFLIQESQNHDTRALQVKLSELIIAVSGAANSTAAAEEMSEKDLEDLRQHLLMRAQETEERIGRRLAKKETTGSPAPKPSR